MLKELDFNNIEEVDKILKFIYFQNEVDYMQDPKWNIVRNESEKYFLYYEEDNKIIWTCSLFKKTKNNSIVLYSPRGPILNYDDKDVLELFFSSIKKWMYHKGYTSLVINPYISERQLSLFPKGLKYYINEKNDYNNLFESCKLAMMNIVFDEEKLIEKLPSKFRQNTRRSYRKGLTFKSDKKIDLNSFYKLYLETADRHMFTPHKFEYFEKIIDIYKDSIVFFEVWKDDIPLAFSIDIIYKNKLIYLYGVSSSKNRNLLGMYYLQWEAIKYCINNKISIYDFGGVFCDEKELNNKDYGLYNFKKGYCYDGFIDIIPDINISFGDDFSD